MNNRKNIWIVAMLVFSLLLLCIALIESILPDNHGTNIGLILDNLKDGWWEVLVIFVTLCSIVAVFYEIILREKIQQWHKKNNLITSDLEKLNKLLEYSKKRAEIEQEISRLTRILSRSDVSEYLNLNHLIFSGQSGAVANSTINYDQFFSQFGINKESIQVNKGYAVFLTPFDASSVELYQTCASILNGMSILLQRTDNIVDKDDIMMNIVSQIVRAEFLVVNIDGRNPNVYYELGIAHAIGKPTILISRVDYPDSSIGFDIRQKQIVLYQNYTELEKGLLYQVNRIRHKQNS